MKFHQEEIREIQEKHPHYTKLIKNMKLKNENSKRNCSLDPHGMLYKKIKKAPKGIVSTDSVLYESVPEHNQLASMQMLDS